MNPMSSPVHLDFQAGDITCCVGLKCCFNVTGNNNNINFNDQQHISKSVLPEKTEKKDDTSVDPILDSNKEEIEQVPKHLLDTFFTVASNNQKFDILKEKQIKKLTPAQNRLAIQKYYNQNADHYTPVGFAFLAAFKNLRFNELYEKGNPLPTHYDKDIQNAIVSLQPLWATTKQVVKLIDSLSQNILNSIGQKSSKTSTSSSPKQIVKRDTKRNSIDVEEIEFSNLSIKKNKKVDKETLQLFINLVPHISTLETKDLLIFRKKARFLNLHCEKNTNFEDEICNFDPFKKETVDGILKISSVIDACMKKEKLQSLKETLKLLSEKPEEELELLALQKLSK